MDIGGKPTGPLPTLLGSLGVLVLYILLSHFSTHLEHQPTAKSHEHLVSAASQSKSGYCRHRVGVPSRSLMSLVRTMVRNSLLHTAYWCMPILHTPITTVISMPPEHRPFYTTPQAAYTYLMYYVPCIMYRVPPLYCAKWSLPAAAGTGTSPNSGLNIVDLHDNQQQHMYPLHTNILISTPPSSTTDRHRLSRLSYC